MLQHADILLKLGLSSALHCTFQPYCPWNALPVACQPMQLLCKLQHIVLFSSASKFIFSMHNLVLQCSMLMIRGFKHMCPHAHECLFMLKMPVALQAATGEDVTAEELGGAELHSTVSGVTDHLAENEAHALSLARDVLGNLGAEQPHAASTQIHPGFATAWEEPLHPTEELRGAILLMQTC